ncbi:MAG: bifunctional adenosylcobinamide kinase/adenosylcobinamide-phosphate guanylyltransferase [Granulosicoccus sp.]
MTVNAHMHRSLILGGVKSGKSGYAERLADAYSKEHSHQVILIATATALDDEMRKRINRHKVDRNKQWLVVEEPLAVASAIAAADQTIANDESRPCIVIDCLTLWVTNLLMKSDETFLRQEIGAFQQSVKACQSRLIMVSNETNMGVTPMGELSRRFCDETGLLHQNLGQICEHIALVVAGNSLNIKGHSHPEL